MNCAEIPAILGENPSGTACRRVAERFTDCRCEQESVSPDFSPGAVNDDEVLVRFVPEKDLDRDTNEVKPSLFDKATKNGMSVTRIESISELSNKIKRDANFCGFVTGRCRDIRSKFHDGKRMFSVYDTAIPTNVSHADVCGNLIVGPKGSESIKMRRTLQEIFTRVMSKFDSSENAANTEPTLG